MYDRPSARDLLPATPGQDQGARLLEGVRLDARCALQRAQPLKHAHDLPQGGGARLMKSDGSPMGTARAGGR
jgi:hypothetical protein